MGIATFFIDSSGQGAGAFLDGWLLATFPRVNAKADASIHSETEFRAIIENFS
jgi:hypothetical protein